MIDLRLNPSLRTVLSELSAFLRVRDVEAYATGGFVRDALLDLPVKDLDISVRADPLEFGPQIADVFAAHCFTLDEDKRLVRVLVPEYGLHLDLRPLEGPIEDDLRRRDYTIDAMAARLHEVAAGSVDLTDPTGGLSDLSACLVRLTGEPALVEDPLRLMRGVRLSVQLDFGIEPSTAAAIRRNAHRIVAAAVERQRDELMQILGTARAARGLRTMEDLGLFPHVLPEMDVTRGVEQPREHYWDVFGHSLEAVAALDILLAEDEPEGEPGRMLWRELWTELGWWEGAGAYLRQEVAPNTFRCALIKLCALLHDSGKPATKTFDETSRMRFFGHAEAGAEIAGRMLQRLHFSSREVALVTSMIRAHLRPVQMAQQGAPTDRAIYRFFRDTGEAGIDTLFLSLADHLATVGPRFNREGWQQHVALVSFVLQRKLMQTSVIEPPKLFRGDELMAELSLSPGPLVGELLELIREAQAAGEVRTREEALELARSRLEQTSAHPQP